MIASKPGRVLTGRLESATRSRKQICIDEPNLEVCTANPSPRPRRRPDVSVIDLTCDDDHEVEQLADEVHALNLNCST
jgi:hypothetical protein